MYAKLSFRSKRLSNILLVKNSRQRELCQSRPKHIVSLAKLVTRRVGGEGGASDSCIQRRSVVF